jgi:uncharacterized protein YyaL (SSP411 family)
LRNYVHGFQSYPRQEFLKTAREIVAWLDGTMTDREQGGFYASQDADIDLDDDGDYFTWTLEEARAVLETDELRLAASYWDIGELGDMHHNPAKNVLHVKHSLDEISSLSDETVQNKYPIPTVLEAARQKLLAARLQRPAPFIDRTLYTGWNAMAVTAYLETAQVLRIAAVRSFALLTLDRLLREAWDGAENLSHVIAYGDESSPAEAYSASVVPGTLDDYAFTIHACIDGWLAVREMKFYHAALKLADAMIERFYDRTAGAFYDAAAPSNGTVPLGALGATRKPVQDAPTPAGNPTAASALLRLEALSGRADYREIAEDTLESFAGIVEHFGLYAGSYGLAVERLILDPLQIVIVGSGPQADRLEATSVAGFAIQKTVIRILPSQVESGAVPEVLAETLLLAPAPPGVEAWALVCRGNACLPPTADEKALLEAIQYEP